ncbi:MAG: haloalkane dehalogenase [Acidimicrobiales bacterium]|nr:haloalkane dehalogenase [Acidimicrobiales bacterium]
MTDRSITSTPLTKSFVDVDGKRMAYHETGEGDPVVFLHGNPTSSYLWRNIIPHLVDRARCIAPDLIGMGDSAPLDDTGPGSYRFVDHRHFLDGLLDALELGDRITFVVHDWGSALGFDWTRRNPDRVAGIAYMEAFVMPVEWDDWPDDAREIFQGLRSPAGEEMVMHKNLFVEAILPASVQRELTDEEMRQYRRPYTEAWARRPTLTWPQEIPVEGEPADVVGIVRAYGDFLARSEIPKLFVNAEPGAILTGRQREFCRGWPNQTEVTVSGIHFIQEDSPHEIGEAIADWLPTG